MKPPAWDHSLTHTLPLIPFVDQSHLFWSDLTAPWLGLLLHQPGEHDAGTELGSEPLFSLK